MHGVGLGAPGLVDRTGTLRYGPNLPGVIDFDFATALTDRVGRPATVDNDATCAAWGEHERGAARGCNHSVTVTLGTGIGAGITVKGELLRGANGFAGEPGHMVVDPDGPLCPCGRRGCWERYASGLRPRPAGPRGGPCRPGATAWSSWPAASPRTCGAST